MPETDILNPQVQAGNGQFSKLSELNPDYGYQRKRPVTHQMTKPKAGPPTLRDITDVGHSFMLTWANRPLATIQTLKRYYEQYRGGYFTYIDWEAGGRHYVGHFSTPVEPIPTGHGRWGAQTQFDEVPLAPMVRYPSDWDQDAVWIYAFDDWGYQNPDTSGVWRKLQDSPNFAGTRRVNGADVSQPYLYNNEANDASWLQVGYFGYGFRLVLPRQSNYGMIDVYLDGTMIQQALDLYSANHVAAMPVLTEPNIPLGLHRVKIVCRSIKNPAATNPTAVFGALQVMR